MAVIRLDDELDNIEKTLTLALFNSTGNNATSKSISTIDSLASSTWEQVTKTSQSLYLMKSRKVSYLLLTPYCLPCYYQVTPEKTLITPVQCKSLWRQFKNETEYTVTQAISAQVFFASLLSNIYSVCSFTRADVKIWQCCKKF